MWKFKNKIIRLWILLTVFFSHFALACVDVWSLCNVIGSQQTDLFTNCSRAYSWLHFFSQAEWDTRTNNHSNTLFSFYLICDWIQVSIQIKSLKMGNKSFGREFWSDFILGNELNPACAANSVDFDPWTTKTKDLPQNQSGKTNNFHWSQNENFLSVHIGLNWKQRGS